MAIRISPEVVLVDHRRVIEAYAIPAEVLSRVGGAPRPPRERAASA